MRIAGSLTFGKKLRDQRGCASVAVAADSGGCENRRVLRKLVLAALALSALGLAGTAYHLAVTHHGAGHYRHLLDAPTVREKIAHYREIHRFYDPLNPYPAMAERWVKEEGHEWEFLRGGIPRDTFFLRRNGGKVERLEDINGGTTLPPYLKMRLEDRSPPVEIQEKPRLK
jgi:hypothetical protein